MLRGRDVAVDLGTANTLVYVRGKGVVLDEPSVVAINTKTGEIMAVGNEAKQMIGRTPPNIVAIRPLKDGVIADMETTERMLRYFLGKVVKVRSWARPRVVICVPTGITSVEKRAVREAAQLAGASKVSIIEEPWAAAIGAGLPIDEATGSMIVDIGGGTTEVAVMSLSGMVTANSVRVGGDELDAAILSHVKKVHSLALGERTAEQIKTTIGSAAPFADEGAVEVRGRDLASGLPRTLTLSAAEVREAISESVADIVEAVRLTLDECPPELSGDVMERGIVLAGGGALLKALDAHLTAETGIPVHIANDPLKCVVLGAGKCVEDTRLLNAALRGEQQ